MIRVGIRELRKNTSELIRSVREDGAEVEITYHGKPVAILIPIERSRSESYDAGSWEKLDLLAAKIKAAWPEGITAAEALSEDRE